MRLYLYPVWLRLWHWLNAVLFLLLIASGVSLHYSATGSLLLPFKTAMAVHNGAGILLSFSYIGFLAGNMFSGNYRQYLPGLRGFFGRIALQAGYYISGIFKGKPHPFETTKERKFNPLQQISYLGIMYALMPAIIVTGWFLLFPEYAPAEVLGLGGIWPMATVHAIAGFLLSMFMFGHIYLATTGATVASNFKSMLTGWHEHEAHPHSAEPTRAAVSHPSPNIYTQHSAASHDDTSVDESKAHAAETFTRQSETNR